MSDPRPYVPWPHSVLRSVAAPVDRVDDEVRAIWDEMLAAMYAMPGVGLAAPQLGISRRLAVVDCAQTGQEPVRMANPELLSAGVELQEIEEGSPNLPGVFIKVKRPSAVKVGFLDESGARVEREFEGLWATSVQHQIDHLNGKMFFDRVSPLKRKMLLAKASKLKKAK